MKTGSTPSPVDGKQPLLVETRKLTKVFTSGGSALTAVDSVDFGLEPGQSIGLVGESGSGKSTLGRMIARLEEPTSGALLIDGQEASRLRGSSLKEFHRRVQIVFQDPYGSLVPRLSAVANVAEPLVIHRVADQAGCRRRALDLLDRVGIPRSAAELYPSQFSGGQQQRIAIARALSLGPEMIVCDEPTSALDVSVQAQVLELLRDIQQERGLSLIVISHNLAVIEQLASQVIVLRSGRVVEQASTTELFARPMHPYTRALIEAVLPVTGPQVALADATSAVPSDLLDGELTVTISPGHLVREVLSPEEAQVRGHVAPVQVPVRGWLRLRRGIPR